MSDDDSVDAIGNMLDTEPADGLANDAVKRMLFSTALLASDLYVPVNEDELTQSAQSGVTLMAVPIDDVPHVLLFSSPERLGAFTGAGTRFGKASGAVILSQVQGNHAILNPGPNGRALAPDDIAQILGKAADGISADKPSDIPHGQPGHVHGPNCKH